MYLALFPDSVVALNEEVVRHTDLQYLLSKYRFPEQFPEMLAEIATYCGVVIEGKFGEDELDDLCHMLTEKLRKKSAILIV